MYQSVFVIAEERRECVIATEVSQNKICLSADPPLEIHHVFPSGLSLTGAPTFMTGDDAGLYSDMWTRYGESPINCIVWFYKLHWLFFILDT